MLYKVIADAVDRGQSMKHSVASTTVSPPPGLPTATTIPKAVTKSARYDGALLRDPLQEGIVWEMGYALPAIGLVCGVMHGSDFEHACTFLPPWR